LRRISASFRLALSQIARNKVMSTASLISITAILLVLGLFFIIVVNINNMAEDVKRDFNQVQVHLLDSVTAAQAEEMMAAIDRFAGVDGTSYLTREDALSQWKEKWGENADLLERMPTNPLPNSIIVKIADLSQMNIAVNQIKGLAGVERIRYSQDTVDKLLQVTRIVQIVSLVVILFLIFVSIMVVSNTIKLTVLAREKEIVIMRYVGATNWFIRGPFLLEGMIIGAVAAGISSALIAVIYHYLVGRFGVDFMLFISSGFVAEGFLIRNLLVIFIALGISIGASGSIISMRRFLDK